MIDEEATFEKFGYHSYDLKPRSRKRIVVACDKCGKSREIKKQSYRALCPSCSRKGIMVGIGNPAWKGGKIKRICKICGNPFEVYPSQIKKGGGKYCSQECSAKRCITGLSGEKNPRWKGGPIKCICQECGNPFMVERSRVNRGVGKYCSKPCAGKATRRYQKFPTHHTKPERIFEEICNRNGLPFKYTGDRSFWLGNANPDFIHHTQKLVCEVFGDFWHSPLLRRNMRYNETLEGRREQLKAEGYKLIMFWETDLLRKDAEAYVLNTLQKLKI